MNIKVVDFISAAGERVQSFQHVIDGRAVLVADFRDGKLDRFACARGHEAKSVDFRNFCYNSI